ncbi:MAG: rhodanese-like domain-containing protein [Anaerolineae bacterium]|nr:rhodanese-like domain-containing protein [Anaerolineae bacterium]
MKARYAGLLLFLAVMVGVILISLSFSETDETPRMDNTNMPGMVHTTESLNTQGVYQTLTIEEFASILDTQPDQYTIINVHIPYDGEVQGTDAHIPFNDLDALTTALPDKNAPVILYCRSGNMSEQASRQLVQLGYTQLWDVPGGMSAWQASGRELLTQ